ncbi:Abi family protein [Jeotgalicoccus sp. WY2]|uniref:Abi family protein n=1 Tax=Jeotgalicoccus sp. WY2 TaxID=2708346 RepID=UPI00201FFA25|nr:Abi family protein [Jeotgalicoccus sp. WY2]
MDEKIYTRFEERIELLKSRNMSIRKNASREIRILKENNYYNLINGYKHLFLDRFEMGKEANKDKGDIFLTGTKPSELHAVLKFDNTLRSLFLKELLTIEDKVKHAIVQSFMSILRMKIYISNLNTQSKNIII